MAVSRCFDCSGLASILVSLPICESEWYVSPGEQTEEPRAYQLAMADAVEVSFEKHGKLETSDGVGGGGDVDVV